MIDLSMGRSLPVVVGLTVFVFVLNAMFPLISDDFCELGSHLSNGAVRAAMGMYTGWNARVGAILSVSLGTHLTGLTFTLANTLVFAIILVLVHPVIFARRASTSRDGWFLIIFFTLLSLSTVFGAVFLWREGSLMYAWALAFIMLHFAVFRYHYAGIKNWYDTAGFGVVIIFCLLSFVAGMSSFDLGALGCLIHICVYTYRKVNSRDSDIRFWLPAVCFIIGFLVLYTAPGTQVRANKFESYTSLSQIFSWLLAFEIPKFTEHYLNALGRSMYKTNYLVLFASIATIRFILKFQSRHQFMPFSIRYLLSGYAVLLIFLVALLFVHTSEPGGDALAAPILFCNFALSAIALYYLLKKGRPIYEHYTPLIIVLLLHVLLIIDVSEYAVGVVPARRAYLGASVLAAFTLCVIIQANWKAVTQRYVFIPLFVISASIISIQTWGLYLTEKMVLTEALENRAATDSILIDTDYKILKAPQFYDWAFLSTDANNWVNKCFSDYHGISGVALKNEVREVNLVRYLKYLIGFERLY